MAEEPTNNTLNNEDNNISNDKNEDNQVSNDKNEDLNNGNNEISNDKSEDLNNENNKISNGQNEDQESSMPKLPYPKSVFFIVSNEFCERFSYYGMKTILSLYLVNVLLYSENNAKIIYHTFNMFCYFFPFLGAIVSDSWLGKFRTILYVSMIYAVGNVLLALAATDPLQFPQAEISMLALLLIAIGTGGIKPCVSAFGGDQFVLPQQEKQLASFFSLFYFSINAGSLISTFLTPVLRENVHCFDNDTCYPVAFAVPGALMVVSIIVFAFGKPLYKIKTPEGNILVKVVSCMYYALKKKCSSKEPKTEHWLDHSKEKFGKKLVDDIKMTLKVLVLYIPLPIFWALFDQQGTGWTFQANRMDGNIGFYTILPDQMQVINPLLILAFIPLFTYVVYPAFAKCNLLKGSLQRMVCGGFLAAGAFGLSACISLMLEATYPVLPEAGNGQIRLYNPSNKSVNLDCNLPGFDKLEPFGYEKSIDIEVHGETIILCKDLDGDKIFNFTVIEEEAVGYYFKFKENDFYGYIDTVDKPENGLPNIRVLVDTDGLSEIQFYDADDNEAFTVNVSSYNDINNKEKLEKIDLIEIKNPGIYKIANVSTELEVKLGGVYTILISTDGEHFTGVEIHEITQPNSVHMLLLIPQYVILTGAEIMFSITGLEFSYAQAPLEMKSVLQACFLLTTAIGNAIIVIIESAKIFEKQSYDFFLYTGLMIVDMLLFAFLAMRYKYVSVEELQATDDNEMIGSKVSEKNGIDNPTFDKDNDDKYK